MAVYEDKDINVALINDKFPKVASAIIAQANENTPALTAEAIKEKYPDIVAGFVAEGVEKGTEVGKIEGAKAETGRLASIDAVAMAGYEDVVAAAKADGKSTAQDVKLAIFDKMQEKTASSASARANDGANLAAQAAELTVPSTDGGGDAIDKKAAEEMMAKAGKKARGEK